MSIPFKLTDKQWKMVEPIVERNRLETRGRKRLSNRDVLNAILFVIQAGGSWRLLLKKEKCLSPQTCHRRYTEWSRLGILDKVIEVLAKDMEDRSKFKLKECFYDEIYYRLKTSFINPFVFNSGSDDIYIREGVSWDIRMENFFSSAWTWRILSKSRSNWVRAQIPADIMQRALISDFRPNLKGYYRGGESSEYITYFTELLNKYEL